MNFSTVLLRLWRGRDVDMASSRPQAEGLPIMTTAAPHQSRSKSVEEQLYTLWSDATALVTARRSDHSVYICIDLKTFPLMGVLFFLAFAAALVRRGRRRVRAELYEGQGFISTSRPRQSRSRT